MSWLYKPQSFKPVPARSAPKAAAESHDDHVGDWEFVLYMGFADRRRGSRQAPLVSDPDRATLVLPVSALVVNAGDLDLDLASESI